MGESKVYIEPSAIEEAIDRWFRDADPGDWCGIFENHDLGHPDLGLRVGFMFPTEQWSEVELKRTHAPDSSIGLGWRYLLIAMCTTPEEAKALMLDDEEVPA